MTESESKRQKERRQIKESLREVSVDTSCSVSAHT